MDVEVEDMRNDDLSDEEGDMPVGGREWSINVPARRSTINILAPSNTGVGTDARSAEDNDPRTAVVTRRFSTQLL